MPARNFKLNSDALISSMFLIERLIALAIRDEMANRVDLLGDDGDQFFRGALALHVREQKHPSLGFEAAAKLLGNAGLAHAPLSSEQNVVAVANLPLQDLQLGFAVKEVVAAYPAACGGLHGTSSTRQQYAEP